MLEGYVHLLTRMQDNMTQNVWILRATPYQNAR
jgi:hypothetical protein